MTFIEFKKLLLDADLTLPKFAKLIKVNDKNLQSYKKKDEVPNAIAALVKSFAIMNSKDISYKEHIKSLNLKKKKKEGSGFSSNKENIKKDIVSIVKLKLTSWIIKMQELYVSLFQKDIKSCHVV